jgi:Lhr-like helicase
MDLDIELPRSELDTVMAHEVWGEYYDRLAELTQAHRTTLVFVNTRKLAERVARHLSERLGEELVARTTGASRKNRGSTPKRGSRPAHCACSSPPRRSSSASTSGRWTWCARSGRRTRWRR